MQAAQERVVKFTRQICDLYHNDVSIYEAIELMRDKDVSSELVKSIYDQLSKEVKDLTKYTRRICNLYKQDFHLDGVIKFMRDKDISAELVKAIYYKLTRDAEKSITDRFFYYTINPEDDSLYHSIYYWTSRYLLVEDTESIDPAFYTIKIIDFFNDKSM
jgi:Zn-dependent M32 family carboxypeptidase